MRDREKLEPSSLERTADTADRAWSARGPSYVTSKVHKGGTSLAKLLALARPVAATRAVYRLFEEADAHTRNVFSIEYDGARAMRFQMPMALILAVKPATLPEEP